MAKASPKKKAKTSPKVSKPAADSAAQAKPKLLTGGNPQIPKGDGDGPVQAYIQAMPGWKQAVGLELDALIVQTVPSVRKAVRWNSPFYGTEGKGWFLSIHCCAKYIKVAFLNGTTLKPQPPIESKREQVRYFHIFEKEPLDQKILANWIKQAAKAPGEECF